MTEKRVVETGISPLASFFLSSAMRVGPGNILGVTGAIAVGGPGALFWMWISSAFLLNGTGLYFLGMPAWFSVSTLGTIVLSLLGVWYLLKKVFIDFEYEDEEEGGEE